MVESIYETLSNYFTPTIVIEIFIIGYIYLFLCHYGKEGWKPKFSDMDKLIFSFSSGFIIYAFLVIPFSIAFQTFHLIFNFKSERIILNPGFQDLIDIRIATFTRLIIIVLMVTLFFKNKRLFKDRHFLRQASIIFGGAEIIIILFFLTTFLGLVGGRYNTYAFAVLKNLFQNVIFISIFILIFFRLQGRGTTIEINYYSKKLKKTIRSNFKIITLGFVGLIILSYLGGIFFIHPSVKKFDKRVEKIFIENADFEHNKILYQDSIKNVDQKYSVKTKRFGLSWIPISTDFRVNSAKTWIEDKVFENKVIINENYVIVNISRHQDATVILYGEEKINLTKSNLTYSISEFDENETIKVNFTIFNKMPYELRIENSIVTIKGVDEYHSISYSPTINVSFSQKKNVVYLSWTNIPKNGSSSYILTFKK